MEVAFLLSLFLISGLETMDARRLRKPNKFKQLLGLKNAKEVASDFTDEDAKDKAKAKEVAAYSTEEKASAEEKNQGLPQVPAEEKKQGLPQAATAEAAEAPADTIAASALAQAAVVSGHPILSAMAMASTGPSPAKQLYTAQPRFPVLANQMAGIDYAGLNRTALGRSAAITMLLRGGAREGPPLSDMQFTKATVDIPATNKLDLAIKEMQKALAILLGNFEVEDRIQGNFASVLAALKAAKAAMVDTQSALQAAPAAWDAFVAAKEKTQEEMLGLDRLSLPGRWRTGRYLARWGHETWSWRYPAILDQLSEVQGGKMFYISLRAAKEALGQAKSQWRYDVDHMAAVGHPTMAEIFAAKKAAKEAWAAERSLWQPRQDAINKFRSVRSRSKEGTFAGKCWDILQDILYSTEAKATQAIDARWDILQDILYSTEAKAKQAINAVYHEDIAAIWVASLRNGMQIAKKKIEQRKQQKAEDLAALEAYCSMGADIAAETKAWKLEKARKRAVQWKTDLILHFPEIEWIQWDNEKKAKKAWRIEWDSGAI